MSDELEVAALQLFEDLRSRLPGLQVRIDPADPHVEISAEIVEQAGLDFAVHLNFQNRDELHLGAGDVFWCSWFPSSDPEVVARYREAVLGVISGEYRIVEHRRWGRGTSAQLQAPGPVGWLTIARSSIGLFGALPFRWGRTEQIVQNRAPARPSASA